jgi:subtilisin family serine protease
LLSGEVAADVLVSVRSPGVVERLAARLDARIVDQIDDRLFALALGDAGRSWKAVAWLNRQPGVLDAEVNAIITTAGVVPNDPSYPAQWSLNQASDIDINAPEAWAIAQGLPSTIVAVVDSGIDFNHPDLQTQIWINPGEVPGNGVDDDLNGYVDDVRGWNFVSGSAVPQDDNGHGTHVSGIIAAAGDNGLGITGVNPAARIMPLKFIDRWGSGSVLQAVQAIRYATNMGARVINASWGTPSRVKALSDVIAWAGSRGVVVVSAAGNSHVNNAARRSYPAMDRYANTLSVAATDASGRLASFSNFGVTSVDLAAPGDLILSTVVGGGYQSWSGTSMAAPHVSGVVSMLLAKHPEYTATQLVQRIKVTIRPIPGLANKVITGGMLDAARAVDDRAAFSWSPRTAAVRGRIRAVRP